MNARIIALLLVALGSAAWGLSHLASPPAVQAAELAPRPQDEQDEEDSARSDRLIVVKAGRVITVTGEELTNASIVIRDGKIEAVGTNVDYPYGSKIIDASDLVVMPGLINPVSRATRLDGGGNMTPNKTFGDALTLEPDDLEAIASTGYTTLGVVPNGSGLPGRSLVMRTGARDTAGLVVSEEGPVFMTFNTPNQDKGRVLQAFKAAQGELDKVEKARKDFEAKKNQKPATPPAPAPNPAPNPNPNPNPNPQPTPTPAPAPKEDPQPKPGPDPKPAPAPAKPAATDFVPPKVNPIYEPIIDLIQKKPGTIALVEFGMNSYQFWAPAPSASSIYLHWKEIPETYDFARAYRVRNSVVASNSPFFVTPESDLELAAADLGKEGAHVAIFPVVNHLPYTRDKFNLGLKLLRAGCRVVYVPERESWNEYAGMREDLARMVRAGFPREEVLKTVTVNAASMLGLGERLGSIEVGRDANLLFLTGDPLSFETKVDRVMIEGRVLDTRRRIR
ncbi:MAG: amidohydrolase family protein [Planctomycetota bacterium]